MILSNKTLVSVSLNTTLIKTFNLINDGNSNKQNCIQKSTVWHLACM